MEEISVEQKARAARLEYYRNWRAKNKDKVKATNERYWIRRAMKLMEEKEAENETE